MPTNTDITFAAPGGAVPALLCQPDSDESSTPRPGLVLIQEIFGINGYIREVAERLAGEGYVTLAPHMYWRIEEDFAIEATGADDLAPAFLVAGQFDMESGLDDLGAAIEYLEASDKVTDSVGLIGFCFGGSMTYMAAAAHSPACGVSYYGSMIGDNLDRATDITCPILFHFGDSDPFLPNEHVDGLRDVTASMDNVEIAVQPGAGHAFDNNHNPMFSNPTAAAAAWARTSAFLAEHLRG